MCGLARRAWAHLDDMDFVIPQLRGGMVFLLYPLVLDALAMMMMNNDDHDDYDDDAISVSRLWL